MTALLDIGTDEATAVDAVRAWVNDNVPAAWREAAARGGAAAIREVRSREEYAKWYPVFGRSSARAMPPNRCGRHRHSASLAG